MKKFHDMGSTQHIEFLYIEFHQYLKNETVSYTHLDVYKRQAIGITPYSAMYEKPTPREIEEIIEFPTNDGRKFDQVKFYNKVAEDQEKRQAKYQKAIGRVITYKEGEKVLLKNRELSSTLEGITKKLKLLYTGPYVVVKNNNNNTYELKEIVSGRVKGVYNQASIMKYYED